MTFTILFPSLYLLSALACLLGSGLGRRGSLACFGPWAAMSGVGIYAGLQWHIWPLTIHMLVSFLGLTGLTIWLRRCSDGEEAAG